MNVGQHDPSANHIVAQSFPPASYGYPWLNDFIKRGAGLNLDLQQIATVAQIAELKLTDLFDVAREIAGTNGRSRILWQDLPLTKGMRRLLVDVAMLAKEIEVEPLLIFLEDAGFRGPLDEKVRAEVPRLMAALLLLEGRIIAILEPAKIPPVDRFRLLTRAEVDHPSEWELERAGQVLDLTL